MSAPKWRIVVACDDAGIEYKNAIIQDLKNDARVASVEDVGVTEKTDKTAYPYLAVNAARKVAKGEADRGLLICGTGIGVAIAAGKVKGIRAAACHDSFSVERFIKSNDGHCLALGQRVIGIELARQLVSQWLGHVFDPQSASAKKVDAICQLEEEENK